MFRLDTLCCVEFSVRRQSMSSSGGGSKAPRRDRLIFIPIGKTHDARQTIASPPLLVESRKTGPVCRWHAECSPELLTTQCVKRTLPHCPEHLEEAILRLLHALPFLLMRRSAGDALHRASSTFVQNSGTPRSQGMFFIKLLITGPAVMTTFVGIGRFVHMDLLSRR